ncbi:MAG: GntR family transcriptional regulator [Oscillospiraceae bacterium]|jgi:GntR family transcriptional regulator of arabinose operon|nr:GntR family transcriptional regulator [Oscillospiraceae bacterium]MCI1990486.1 GntR family transcriptional regulator [Oscillospiraceae bacterium]MCI2035086.1 GntR family transcriptional regulator [Oscillospiraceae bacterium]
MAYKYLRLKEDIKSRILSGQLKNGEKIGSEAELSRQYHVSRQTVRGALAELVREGLLYTVQAKGSFVCSEPGRKTKTGLLGFGTELFKRYNIFPNIITGINEVVSTQEYNILICEDQNTLAGERKCLENFLEKNVDGLIIEPCKSMLPCVNLDLYSEFLRRKIPIVFFDGCHPEVGASCVLADDEEGGYQAAKCLLGNGHRDICAFLKFDDMQGYRRLKGAARAFREAGVPVREDRIVWFSTEDYDYFWDTEGKDRRFDPAILNFAETCTAMIAYNDLVAAKALRLFRRQGIRVPQDFSLVSFDDTDLTKPFGVGVTSVPHPSYRMGRTVGEFMVKMLKDPEKKFQSVLPCEIILRDSVRKIR